MSTRVLKLNTFFFALKSPPKQLKFFFLSVLICEYLVHDDADNKRKMFVRTRLFNKKRSSI